MVQKQSEMKQNNLFQISQYNKIIWGTEPCVDSDSSFSDLQATERLFLRGRDIYTCLWVSHATLVTTLNGTEQDLKPNKMTCSEFL